MSFVTPEMLLALKAQVAEDAPTGDYHIVFAVGQDLTIVILDRGRGIGGDEDFGDDAFRDIEMDLAPGVYRSRWYAGYWPCGEGGYDWDAEVYISDDSKDLKPLWLYLPEAQEPESTLDSLN